MPGRSKAHERPWTQFERKKLATLAACFSITAPCPIHSRTVRMGGRPEQPDLQEGSPQPALTLEAALTLFGEPIDAEKMTVIGAGWVIELAQLEQNQGYCSLISLV